MKNNTHPQPARDAHATTAGAHISPNSKDPIQICNRAPVSASLMPHPNPFPHTHPSLTFPSQAPVMVHRLGRDALRSETRRRNNNDLSPNSETPAVCCTWATCSCLATTPRVTTLRWAKQNLSRGNGEGRWRWGSGVCGKQAGGGSCVAMAGPGLAWPAMVWQSQQKTPPPLAHNRRRLWSFRTWSRDRLPPLTATPVHPLPYVAWTHAESPLLLPHPTVCVAAHLSPSGSSVAVGDTPSPRWRVSLVPREPLRVFQAWA